MAVFIRYELQHGESDGATGLVYPTQLGNSGYLGSPAESRLLGLANNGAATAAFTVSVTP